MQASWGRNMTEGRWKPRLRTLREAQDRHNRSLPKEPREAKQISLHRAFGIQPRSDQAVKLPKARTLTASLLALLLFWNFFLANQEKS